MKNRLFLVFLYGTHLQQHPSTTNHSEMALTLTQLENQVISDRRKKRPRPDYDNELHSDYFVPLEKGYFRFLPPRAPVGQEFLELNLEPKTPLV